MDRMENKIVISIDSYFLYHCLLVDGKGEP